MPKYSAGGYDSISATELLDKLETRGQRIKTTGKILRYLRKKAGMSQKDIASMLGIVQQTYAGYENGHHEPNMDFLVLLADFHKVTLDYISGRIFDDWTIEPFFNMEDNDRCHMDLLEHAKRQYEDFKHFSDMTMDARIHGRYDRH